MLPMNRVKSLEAENWALRNLFRFQEYAFAYFSSHSLKSKRLKKSW